MGRRLEDWRRMSKGPQGQKRPADVVGCAVLPNVIGGAAPARRRAAALLAGVSDPGRRPPCSDAVINRSRITPAMALSVTDHIWENGELIEAAIGSETPEPEGRRVGRFPVIDDGEH